jgi:hypothetical protein
MDGTPLARRRPTHLASPPPASSTIRAHTPTAPSGAAPLGALRGTTHQNQSSTPDLLVRPATVAAPGGERRSPLTLVPARSSSAQSLRAVGGPGSRGASPSLDVTHASSSGGFRSVAPDVQLSPEFDDADVERFNPDSLASLSLVSTSPSAPPAPACLLAADARLSGYRRSPGRAQTIAGMSAAQLVDERKCLKKELQQARERHLPAPSTSPPSGKATLGSRSSSRSNSPSVGKIACEHCTGDVDWKVTFQPMLIAYKQVNAALKAKGIVVDASGTATSATAGSSGSTSRPGSAGGGLQHVSSTPVLTSLQHLTATGTTVTAPNHRLGPLTPLAPSIVPAASSSSSSSSAASTGGGTTITVARARGMRKVASTSGPLISAVPTLVTGGSATGTTVPLVRSNSRSSSPSPATGSLPTTAGSASTFAAWTQQSHATVQQAQAAPAFKQASSTFNPYGGAQTTANKASTTQGAGAAASAATGTPSQTAWSKAKK